MSAFVVADSTINRVVSFLAHDRDGDYIRRMIQNDLGLDLTVPADQRKLAEAMFKLNCDGVNARYGEGEAEEFRPLNFRYAVDISVNRIQAYKSLGCWSYQCAEGDIPDTSLLYATMERVKGEMADDIVRRLPQYEAAKWD